MAKVFEEHDEIIIQSQKEAEEGLKVSQFQLIIIINYFMLNETILSLSTISAYSTYIKN